MIGFDSIPISIPFQHSGSSNRPYHDMCHSVGPAKRFGLPVEGLRTCNEAQWLMAVHLCLLFLWPAKTTSWSSYKLQRPNGYSATIIRKRKKKRLASQFHPGPIHSKTSSKKDVNWCKKNITTITLYEYQTIPCQLNHHLYPNSSIVFNPHFYDQSTSMYQIF